MGKKVNKEVEEKSLEEKTIIEKHTIEDKFHLGPALLDIDNKIKQLYEITYQQHNALEFINAWFEQNAKNVVQVDKPKIELLK